MQLKKIMHYKTTYLMSSMKEYKWGLIQADAQKSIYVFKGLIIKDCHASIWKCDNIQKHSVKYKREAFGEMNYTSTNGARCSGGERA